ncbi:MAG: toll/interleukin-1 receptor domain-containing protein [Bryobacterales bacterium]|nr:toll/interleukin-1 receptor domain-containing protein [Bryobacterales bacterium]
MTETGRDAIFISHANPEDNAFTVWLGARLTAAGYQVWADILRLRGGQDWQRRLEGCLRNKAFKVLLVGTEEGVKKQGVRNEVQIAHSVGQRIGDPDFVIPLRLTDFDAPFLIAHAQYIDFKRIWADGLAELLETLEQSHGVPRRRDRSGEVVDSWKQIHMRHGQSLRAKSESLVSNWLRIEELPEAVSLYDFRGPVSLEDAGRKKTSATWPVVPFRRGFLAFCPPRDLQDHFGPSLPLKIVGEIGTVEFLDDGWPDQDIEKWDAHNLFGSLVRQALESTLRAKLLSSHELANNQLAWWGNVRDVPSGQIGFSWRGGLRGRRQIVGYSAKRHLHWHYGVTPKPRVYPFPHVRFVGRVVFTEDGVTPIGNAKRMHRLRRSFAKSWRNAKWRDMLLAFLHWLSDGDGSLALPIGANGAVTLGLPPVVFTAPMSVALSNDAEEESDTEDELATGDDDLLDMWEQDEEEEQPETIDFDNHRDGHDTGGSDDER